MGMEHLKLLFTKNITLWVLGILAAVCLTGAVASSLLGKDHTEEKTRETEQEDLMASLMITRSHSVTAVLKEAMGNLQNSLEVDPEVLEAGATQEQDGEDEYADLAVARVDLEKAVGGAALEHVFDDFIVSGIVGSHLIAFHLDHSVLVSGHRRPALVGEYDGDGALQCGLFRIVVVFFGAGNGRDILSRIRVDDTVLAASTCQHCRHEEPNCQSFHSRIFFAGENDKNPACNGARTGFFNERAFFLSEWKRSPA